MGLNTAATFSNLDIEQSIAQRFEAQVAMFGGRTAIALDYASMTYDDLNKLSNQIAHAISRHYPSDDPIRIAIYLDKGFQYIASILAVLKAGHTYIPLDPSFPQSRNDHILKDSSVKLILLNNQSHQHSAEFNSQSVDTINLDELEPELPDTNLCLDISPDTLAYIIYTSGSTGNPKGVMQNHRNTLHGCMRRSNLQNISYVDNLSLFYSCSVMGSVYCIFGALLNGASLHPYDFREQGLDSLAEWLVRHKITVYHSVASVFRQFAVSYQGTKQHFFVRLVIFGGEKVLASDIKLARDVFSNEIIFFTGMGSTETGTIRHLSIDSNTVINTKTVPLGFPVEGVDVVLVDEHGKAVPPGTIGEITVRSPYLALGYWGKPEISSEVFSHDPENPEIRIYRMGDMGEISSNGVLEHRGRKDFQVKIRGFRVEVGEVEAALVSHARVFEAVVVAKEIGVDTQLVAYFVDAAPAIPNGDRQPQEALSVKMLRGFLKEKLPAYMIPSVFVVLTAIPKTPNNKVDRNSLPDPLPSNELIDDTCIEAGNSVEQSILTICQDLLKRPVMGVNQNFFEYGGDSLTATQLVSRVNKLFNVSISMRAIFEAANIADIASHIMSLDTNEGDVKSQSLTRHAKDVSKVLSFSQQRMWLIDQFYGVSSAYNISNAVRLKGVLNVPALEKSLNDIVFRHETLRTIFVSKKGDNPLQKIVDFAPFTLDIEDASHCPLSVREETVLRFSRELLRTLFDLSSGPLFLFKILQLDRDDFVLGIVFHHIIYDNIWSSGVFFKELGAIYAFYANPSLSESHQQYPLPSLDFQFSDYALWERQKAHSGRLGGHVEYWIRQLSNLPQPLQLPSDRPRLKAPSFKGDRVSIAIPEYMRSAMVDLSRSEGVTTFMLLLAIWQLLLSRYGNQSDVLIGTPTGRRHLTETEGMIGLFINNLVMRINIDEKVSFRDFLKSVRQMSIDAFTHDDVPFEQLVSELKPERIVGAPPFFQHFFIHRNATNASWKIPGVEVTPLKHQQSGSKFDLTLSVLETEYQINCTFEYSLDLFDSETVERMAENYVELLGAALESPNVPIGTLDFIACTERQLILNDWNDTAVEYPLDESVEDLFERRVVENPNSVAIISDSGTLTYLDLNARANVLALKLQSLGVGPDVLVAVCLPRSVDLVVSFLAVLKSGAAYVPLDPEFPADRLKYMIEDSQSHVFISDEHIIQSLPDLTATVLLMDSDAEPLSVVIKNKISHASGPKNLAYVIYTSGSTGRPKGVQITRQSLSNFLFSMTREPGITSRDVMQSLTTVCFDIAALELFLPLVVGAKLILSRREVSMSPERLIKSMIEHSVTIMQATPITWRLLLESGWTGIPKVKVLCGGEAMGVDLAEKLISTGCEVWNLYGPTETTIWSSVKRIQLKADASFLGYPIANTTFYICNPQQKLLPIGVPGELLIGGDGLARGYLNLKDLTDEKFIPDPFNINGRLYRTGDLAIRRKSGSIEFLGRIDNQVKIRGYRIELGEIEGHISSHPSIKQGVVIASNEAEKKLIAYYIPRSEESLSSTTLIMYLRDRLPAYMIPSVFVSVSEFPQTPNGKIDRKKLPVPVVNLKNEEALEVQYSDESSPLLSEIEACWKDVFGLDLIKYSQNFFEMGGDSMLLIRLVTALNQLTNLRVEVENVISNPSIGELFRYLNDTIGDNTWGGENKSLFKVDGRGDGIPLFLIAGAHQENYLDPRSPKNSYEEDFYRYFSNFVRFLGGRRPIYGLKPRHLICSGEYPKDVQAMAADHILDIKSVQPTGPYLIGGECVGGIVAYEIARQLEDQGDEVLFTLMMDTPFPNFVYMIRKSLKEIRKRVKRVYGNIFQCLKARQFVEARTILWSSLVGIACYFTPVTKKMFYEKLFRYSGLYYRFKLLEYRPKVSTFRGLLLVNQEWWGRREALGWKSNVIKNFTIKVAEGTHHTRLTVYGNVFGKIVNDEIDLATQEYCTRQSQK